MNRFFKRSAALFATALALLSGGICLQNDGIVGGITASAQNSLPQTASVSGSNAVKQTGDDLDRLFFNLDNYDPFEESKVTGIKVSTGYDTACVQWEKLSGAQEYNVYAGTDPKHLAFVTSTDSQSAEISDLYPESEYTFAVEGRFEDNYSRVAAAQAETLGFETLGVEGFKAEAAKLKTITFSWDAVKDAEKYTVSVISKDGKSSVEKTTGDTSLTITGLEVDTIYSCTVTAESGGKNSHSSSITAATAKVDELKVGGINAKPKIDTLTLSWEAIDGIDTYVISSVDKNGRYTPVKTVSKSITVELTGLAADTCYRYSVQGKLEGKLTLHSIINAKTAGIDTLSIKNIKAKNITLDTITLCWDKLSYAKNYNIYLKDANGKCKLLRSVSANRLTLGSLRSGTSYTFVVRGQKSGKLTAESCIRTRTLRSNVKLKFEALNQLGGKGNSGKVKATYGCGGTSTTMLLNAKGLNLNKDSVLKKQYVDGWDASFTPFSFPFGASFCGSVMRNLVDLAKSYGFSPKLNTAPKAIDIMRVLDGDDLVLVGLRTARGAYHFQIIYGYYVKNGVTYFRVQDPYGNYLIDWTESYLLKRIYSVNMKDPLCAQVRGIMWL